MKNTRFARTVGSTIPASIASFSAAGHCAGPALNRVMTPVGRSASLKPAGAAALPRPRIVGTGQIPPIGPIPPTTGTIGEIPVISDLPPRLRIVSDLDRHDLIGGQDLGPLIEDLVVLRHVDAETSFQREEAVLV